MMTSQSLRVAWDFRGFGWLTFASDERTLGVQKCKASDDKDTRATAIWLTSSTFQRALCEAIDTKKSASPNHKRRRAVTEIFF